MFSVMLSAAQTRQIAKIASVTLIALMGRASWVSAGSPFTPVVLSGDAAPIAGTTYSTFETPVLSDDGRIVFGATLAGSVSTSNDQGLFVTGGSGSSLIAREGSPSPIAGHTYTGSFLFPILRGGTLLFQNLSSGTLSEGLFGGTNLSAPILIGQSTNTQIRGRVDALGDIAFGTVVGGVSRQFYVAAKTGSVLASPITLAPSDFNANRTSEIWMNDHGGVAFDASLSSAQGMFISSVTTPGTRTPAATITQSAPWVGAGESYSTIGAGGFNNNGDVAYTAGFTPSSVGNANGLFLRTADGTTTMLALQGTTSPSGGQFGSFFDPTMGPISLTNSGNAIFAARTSTFDTAQGDSAIYLFNSHTSRTIARENDPVPDLGGTFVYSDLFVAGEQLGVDSAGRVLFTVNLDDTTTTGLDGVGLMVYDPATDKTHLLLRTGGNAGLFDIRGDGSVFSSIDSITLAIPSSVDPNNHDAMEAVYGDQVTFRLDFHNGLSGIYTTAVPEPGALAIATLLAFLGVRRRAPRLTRPILNDLRNKLASP